MSTREHSLIVKVEDKGLPFGYNKLKEMSDTTLNKLLAKNHADEVNYSNLQ